MGRTIGLGLAAHPPCDPRTLAYSIARVQQDFVADRKAGEDLRTAWITVPDLNPCGMHPSGTNGEDCPVITLPKQRAERNTEHIIGAPDGDVNDHAEAMSESGPCFRRINNIDGDADPLFLNPQCRNLEKTRRIDASHVAADRRSHPTRRCERTHRC